jgi:outer membrane lipoprotein-sorting protein
MIYLPTFKKIRRVETQQQSGSFMGSVFSYSDIATPHVVDYQYAKIKDEACPSPEAAGLNCHVIEATPINEDIRDRTGYSKSTVWVRPDNFMLVQAHYFGLDGQMIKILKSSQTKLLNAAKQKWHSHRVEMQGLKSQESTILEFTSMNIEKDIPNSTFTQQHLQKVP